ncbi:MAG: heavy metal translocating P-type ATPase [Lachnospiraceae bacterium]|nr:heavy metal translocating P-type ATPase [Lachnospiraceae bacterium]
MKCKIMHESRGRLRVHMVLTRMTLHQADVAEYYLRALPAVTKVKVYDRTADAVIWFDGQRDEIIMALARFSFQNEENEKLVPEHTGRELNRRYEEELVMTIAKRYLKKWLLPLPIHRFLSIINACKYVWKGIRSLCKGQVDVSVLDATAISVSMLRGDFGTAASVMFLLRIGEILEEWTHKKSVDDLARTMSLGVEKAWVKMDDSEVLLPITQIQAGDLVIVRTGSMIPLDGCVCKGEAMVNQASMTGESLPVKKDVGSYVYAGSVVEEGECLLRVDKVSGTGRYDRIVRMIEESEKLKSESENRAARLADRLVPYTLGGTLLTYLLTRNPTKTLSVLMVDFSCALKLAIPICVLSAMKEGSEHGMTIKGGKFLEAVAQADTIVFDKTGTLTHAMPRVVEVIPFHGSDADEDLRMAACLEEHYPHPMANAVVDAALEKGLTHEEMHSEISYVVAHGIASTIDEKRVVIGSYHFVMEDEGCKIAPEDQETFDALTGEQSYLYFAVGGVLSAVICIEDPVREEAPEVIKRLRELGFQKIVMMTGDNEKTAAAMAKRVGVDAYYAEVLPEEKAAFVKKEKEEGRKVIMIGDGINDSPALSEADAGIAISTGAAIAKEIADITISAESLDAIVTLKELSNALTKRIDGDYRFIISFNAALILLGVGGIIQPTTSALLHNASTLGIGLKSMTTLL